MQQIGREGRDGEEGLLPLGEARNAMFFYGEPTSIEASHNLKKEADSESLQAAWFTVDELREMRDKKMLRYDEPIDWGEFVQRGGHIAPISLIADWIPSFPP